MSESQEIRAEVEIPSTQQRFDNSKFYNWQLVKQDFSGEGGAKLADEHVCRALRELDGAEEAVPSAGAAPLVRIRERLDMQAASVRGSLDAEARRGVVEEVRLIRQEIAMVCQQPDARRHLLLRRLAEQRNFYESDIREGASRDQLGQFAALVDSAESTIDQGGKDGFDIASDLIVQINGLYWTHGFAQEMFCAKQYVMNRQKRHLASNPSEFDRLVAEGDAALNADDLAAVKKVFIAILFDQMSLGGETMGPDRAALMRA